MTKHQLDRDVEDFLEHHGIKGMRWGVRRTDAEIAAAQTAKAQAGGGGGGDEEDDELIDSYGELFEALKDKLEDKVDNIKEGTKQVLSAVSQEVKKKGAKFMDSIFNKGLNGSWHRNEQLERDLAAISRAQKGMSDKDKKALEKAWANPKKLPGSKW